MESAKPLLPKGRERPVPLHPRYLPDDAWSTIRMVRFSDCDPAGIVYTPRFIDMANGVIEDFFLGKLRINYHALIQVSRIGMGYRSVDTDFFKPALMGERLSFTVLIEHIGRTSVIFSIHCIREIEEIMRCRLVMVTTSLNTNSAIDIPVNVKNALIAYRESCR
jgi:4-hydroxybenzoyl-CoA thioesterase